MKIEKSFRDAHAALEDAYSELIPHVDEIFLSACKVEKEWHFSSRPKELESYVLKVLSGRFDGYLIDDFYACTLIVPNLVFIDKAKKFVTDSFAVIEEKPGEETKSRPSEFNFDGLRYTCKLKPSVKKRQFEDLVFEIQIKTFLEHAWAVATHSFSYKGTEISWAKERLSAQIKAVLDNADLTIFEANNLSASSFLKRKNRRYEKIAEIIDFLGTEIGANTGIAMPNDYKRLAEEINNLLIRVNINIDEMKSAIENETIAGRGKKTRNLSIYSLVLESIRNQHPDKFQNGLLSGNKRSPKIVIPAEISIDPEVLDKDLINVTFLEKSQNQIKNITNAN